MACRPKSMDDVEKVRNTFRASEQPLKAGDVAAELGIDQKEVTKIIDWLKEQGELTSPKRCFYTLAEK